VKRQVAALVVLEEGHPFLRPVRVGVDQMRGASHAGAPVRQGGMGGGDIGCRQVKDVGLVPGAGFLQHQSGRPEAEEGEAGEGVKLGHLQGVAPEGAGAGKVFDAARELREGSKRCHRDLLFRVPESFFADVGLGAQRRLSGPVSKARSGRPRGMRSV
jgi:hypothetical protein